VSKHKKKHEHEEHIDESWLIPYADLLTLLLALFIILFASSQVDSKKYEQIMASLNSAFTGGISFLDSSNMIPIQPNPNSAKTEGTPNDELERLKKEQSDLEKLKQEMDRYIQDNKLTTEVVTTLTEDMLMINIRDTALFASGSATVKPEAGQLGVKIAEMISLYPDYQIEVAGHTDNVPISNREFESNWDLSSKRALNFMKILLGNTSVNQARFRSSGFGEFRPIDTNDTLEGRAKNRRVEVNIMRNVKPTVFKNAN